jgi:integrase
MHNCIQKACLLGKLEKNPCVGIEFKGTKKKEGIKFIESSDIPCFLQAAHQYGYIYWIFFKLLIETGMRKGEAAALKWTDIDFKEKKISISETLDFTAKTKSEVFGDTKTFLSTRVISMSQSLTNDLRHNVN